MKGYNAYKIARHLAEAHLIEHSERDKVTDCLSQLEMFETSSKECSVCGKVVFLKCSGCQKVPEKCTCTVKVK